MIVSRSAETGRFDERERGGDEGGREEGGSVTFLPILTLDNSRDNRRSSQSHGTKLLQKGFLYTHMNILRRPGSQYVALPHRALPRCEDSLSSPHGATGECDMIIVNPALRYLRFLSLNTVKHCI